jgi:hypothetical protein
LPPQPGRLAQARAWLLPRLLRSEGLLLAGTALGGLLVLAARVYVWERLEDLHRCGRALAVPQSAPVATAGAALAPRAAATGGADSNARAPAHGGPAAVGQARLSCGRLP